MALRRAAGVACGLAALALGGCEPGIDRSDPDLLRRATVRAFERAFTAEHRMRTGRVDLDLLIDVTASCRPASPPPAGERDWRWTCRVVYRERSGLRRGASYLLSVDPRACFQADSTDFPARVFERILARSAPNPLVRLRSCP